MSVAGRKRSSESRVPEHSLYMGFIGLLLGSEGLKSLQDHRLTICRFDDCKGKDAGRDNGNDDKEI